MHNIHSGFVSLGLDDNIKVTTLHSMAMLSISFPPSSPTFDNSLLPIMKLILKFLDIRVLIRGGVDLHLKGMLIWDFTIRNLFNFSVKI